MRERPHLEDIQGGLRAVPPLLLRLGNLLHNLCLDLFKDDREQHQEEDGLQRGFRVEVITELKDRFC